MGTELSEMKCGACRAGSPVATEDEICRWSKEVPDWKMVEVGGVARLRRKFTFPDFKKAMAFAVKVGEEAEAEDHHPRIVVTWGKVTVDWWTHAIGDLHRNDFIMAARTDKLRG